MLKKILDQTLIPLIKYLKRSTSIETGTRVLDEVSRRIAKSSADYIEQNMTASIVCNCRELLWEYAFNKSNRSGLVLEFGVSEGKSINYFANLIDQKVFGFDSFEGLREDWAGNTYLRGHFSRSGELPKVVDNVQLVKGWFHETLPIFLKTNSGSLKLLHIDSDTYEASQVVLELLQDRIVPGTIIIFDEYFGYLGWKNGEYKAFQELVQVKKLKYKYLAFSENSVAVELV